nr:hypothetical protein [Tanacetum cinerariifolium]
MPSCLVHLLFGYPLRPSIKASYSTSLLVALHLNLRAYVNLVPSGFVTIRPAPDPSVHDDPSIKSIHESESSSLSSMEDIDTDVLEDIKADATAVEVAVDKDVVAGVNA